MSNPNALTIAKYNVDFRIGGGQPVAWYLRNGEYPGDDLNSHPKIDAEGGLLDLFQVRAIDAETGDDLEEHPLQGSNRFTWGILVSNNDSSYISYQTINTAPPPNPNMINYFN